MDVYALEIGAHTEECCPHWKMAPTLENGVHTRECCPHWRMVPTLEHVAHTGEWCPHWEMAPTLENVAHTGEVQGRSGGGKQAPVGYWCGENVRPRGPNRSASISRFSRDRRRPSSSFEHLTKMLRVYAVHQIQACKNSACACFAQSEGLRGAWEGALESVTSKNMREG
eukprot:364315-Chlamydomonas_euryale.AAC.1